MAYDKIIVPREGSQITVNDDLSLKVPNDPIIPFIEGGEIDSQLTPMMKKVVDTAVETAYGNAKKVHWMEVYWGEKAAKIYDGNSTPAETLQAFKEFAIGIAPISNQDEQTTIYATMHEAAAKYHVYAKEAVNPSSLLQSTVLMLHDMGWIEAADLIAEGVEKTITKHTTTDEIKSKKNFLTTLDYSEFGEAVITEM